MSKLDDWQAQIDALDKAILEQIVAIECNDEMAVNTAIAQQREIMSCIDFGAIARQALKVALAAEALCTPPFDSETTLPALRQALKEIES